MPGLAFLPMIIVDLLTMQRCSARGLSLNGPALFMMRDA
jgi:hypothetical protein